MLRAIAADPFVPVLSPGELKNPEFMCHLQIGLVLIQGTVHADTDQVGAAVSALPCTVDDWESRKSICWMTSQLQELSEMRNVYKMSFDLVLLVSSGENVQLFWPATWTRLMCGLSTQCAVVGMNGAVLQVTNTCNLSAMTLFVNASVHTEAESIRQNWQADSRICFGDPPSPPNMHRTCFDLEHATGEMTRPAVQSLLYAESYRWHQGCLAIQSQRPCQGVTRHIS